MAAAKQIGGDYATVAVSSELDGKSFKSLVKHCGAEQLAIG